MVIAFLEPKLLANERFMTGEFERLHVKTVEISYKYVNYKINRILLSGIVN